MVFEPGTIVTFRRATTAPTIDPFPNMIVQVSGREMTHVVHLTKEGKVVETKYVTDHLQQLQVNPIRMKLGG